MNVMDWIDETEYMGVNITPLLHPFKCKGRRKNVRKMQKVLGNFPYTLNRLQSPCLPSNNYGEITALQDAAQMGHVLCVEFLVQAGADINKLDESNSRVSHGHSALEFAWQGSDDNNDKCLEVMKVLLKHGALPNDLSKPNKVIMAYSLVAAIENGETEIVQLLLSYDAVPEDMMISEADGKMYPMINPENHPFYSALSEAKTESYRLLLFYGATFSNIFTYKILTKIYKFSVPQYIIERYLYCNLSTKEMLEALKVFQSFGGNLWNMEVEVCEENPESRLNENVLEFLRRQKDVDTLVPGLEGELEKLMGNPMSLKALSRVAVRKAMGREMWKHIAALEIANELKDFLHFGVVPLK